MASYLNPFSWSFQINKALLPLPASSNISIHLHTNTCRLISAHVFIKTHVLTHFHTYLHTIIFTHKYILSGSFISMRITNLTTVALNLHVNDDYFGCFRLFLQIRAFISFQSRFVVYHICMGLSKMCPILLFVEERAVACLPFMQLKKQILRPHWNDQHLILCKIYAGQSCTLGILHFSTSPPHHVHFSSTFWNN